MVLGCPQYIEDALWSAAKDNLSSGALKRSRLVQAIVDRTLLYTERREELSEEKLHSDSDVAARALFFAIADIPKIFYILGELEQNAKLELNETLRVLDVGAGVGTLTFGLAHFFSARGLFIDSTLLEREPKISSLAANTTAYLKQAGMKLNVQSTVADLGKTKIRGVYDFVLMGTVLNELSHAAQKEIIDRAFSVLSENGTIIIIEPALKQPSRNLHHLRDWIIKEQKGFIFAPCTHAMTSCPMLTSPKDWCHEDVPSSLPEIANQMSQATGLRDGSLKFSYLVLQKHQRNCGDAFNYPARAVSRLKKSKSGSTVWACSASGLTRTVLAKRQKSPNNKPLIKMRRGDVFSLNRELKSEVDELNAMDKCFVLPRTKL